MPDPRALRILLPVGVANGIVCTVAPAMILSHPGGTDAPVGSVVFWAAAVAVALTPLQAAVIWLVIRGPVAGLVRRGRTRHLVNTVLAGRGMTIAFQPVVDMPLRRVRGAEALARFTIGSQKNPEVWFRDAHEAGLGVELELYAAETALRAARALPPDMFVSVNLAPCTLMDRRLWAVLAASPIPARRIVIEVTEHESIADYEPLISVRETLRGMGVRLAVDDAGAGYASLRHILNLTPDLLKIDRSLISGIDSDPVKRSMLAGVALFASQSGSTLLAEGVETQEESSTLVEMGVPFAQGYFIGKPSTDPMGWAAWEEPPTVPSPRVPDAVYVIPR